jgi:hypothetical protein
MRRQLLGLAVTCLVSLFADYAEAQALRYVDEFGVVHWVKSKDQIPEKYRDKAEKPDLPGAPPPRSHRQQILELCQRDSSLQTQIQCDAWMKNEERERLRRIREAEYEQQRAQRQYDLEQQRLQRQTQYEQQRAQRQYELEQRQRQWTPQGEAR